MGKESNPLPKPPPFGAVLFDLYETLITERGTSPTRASTLGQTLGLDEERFRMAWRQRRSQITLGQSTLADALATISTELAGSADEGAIRAICAERVRQKSARFARVHPEIESMIGELKRRELRLGVISNCFPEDVTGWQSWPLAKAFDCAVFSWEVKLAKPDPEIYRLALRRLGVEARDAVFIGDGGDDELGGAERTGLSAWRAAWFSTGLLGSEFVSASRIECRNCRDLAALIPSP